MERETEVVLDDLDLDEGREERSLEVVLAAVDDSAAARPVLAAALRVAELTGAVVEALHVSENGPGATAAAAASAAGVPLRERRGHPVECIIEAASDPEIVAVVLGARRMPGGHPTVGHVALDVICAVEKPVVVVPPVVGDGRIGRILVPHDGTGATTDALRRLLGPVSGPGGPEIVVLHVFEPETLPLFGDQAAHETEAWSREFLDRCSPVPGGEARLEVRVGPAEETVRQAGEELGADVVALGWKRDLSPGRAKVVRAMLSRCEVPVILLPVAVAEAAANAGI